MTPAPLGKVRTWKAEPVVSCPNCGCEVVVGANIHTCDVCGKDCCTPCSDDYGICGVICLDCKEAITLTGGRQ